MISEQYKKQLYGRSNYLKPYMEELYQFFDASLTEVVFLPFEESNEILATIKQKKREIICEHFVPFQARKDARLIIQSHSFPIHTPYYFWVEYSNYCGIIQIPSLDSFNWFFNYNVDKNGIIVFIDATLEKEIKLDFYEEKEEQKLSVILSILD